MTVKVAYGKLAAATEPLNNLLKQKIPIAGVVALIDAVEKIAEAQIVYDKSKQLLLKDYIERDEKGEPIHPKDADVTSADGTVTPGKVHTESVRLTPEGITKMNELNATEAEIDLKTVPIKYLGSAEGVTAELFLLRWLFEA